jgi:hypothetical protein
MNRRLFICTAAKPAIAAFKNATAAGPVDPIECDLGEPGAAAYVAKPNVDLCAYMEEPHDPGQSSGTCLRIMNSGKFMMVNAESGNCERCGSSVTHCFGYVTEGDIFKIQAATGMGMGFAVLLRELHEGGYYDERPSGAKLVLDVEAEPELRLYLGSHLFGLLRGKLLATFLSALRSRAEDTRA